MICQFQLLAALLTIYTYGYAHNSVCVHTITHLYTYLSTMDMPMCTLILIFLHIIYLRVAKMAGVLN